MTSAISLPDLYTVLAKHIEGVEALNAKSFANIRNGNFFPRQRVMLFKRYDDTAVNTSIGNQPRISVLESRKILLHCLRIPLLSLSPGYDFRIFLKNFTGICSEKIFQKRVVDP